MDSTNPHDLDAATDAYIEAALWAGLDWREPDENPEPLDRHYTASDLAPGTRDEIRAEVSDFADSAGPLVDDLDPEQVGHDFYLTRNRHGAGFWDRGLGPAGDTLTRYAHAYGSSDLYVGDDGRLYVHG